LHRRNSASFRRHIQGCAAVVVEGATVPPLQHGATTMLALGLLLNTVGLGIICWLIFTLAVYVLPFFVLCGRPHNTNYVAFWDMWRTSRLTPSLREI
jgi:hypothetical protein